MKIKIGVTSDQFQSLSRYGNVYSIAELQRCIEAGQLDLTAEPVDLLLGQLFSAGERRKLRSVMASSAFEKEDIDRIAEPAKGYVVHKKSDYNSLISNITVHPDHYSCDLVISAGSEMVSDHTTGEHISGMVLLEAARQMNIAAIDSKFSDGQKRYQVISDIVAEFSSFVHPFETHMELRFDTFKAKGGKAYIDGRVDFMQGGRLCASVRMKGSAFVMELARKMEEKSVKRYLRHAGINIDMDEVV